MKIFTALILAAPLGLFGGALHAQDTSTPAVPKTVTAKPAPAASGKQPAYASLSPAQLMARADPNPDAIYPPYPAPSSTTSDDGKSNSASADSDGDRDAHKQPARPLIGPPA